MTGGTGPYGMPWLTVRLKHQRVTVELEREIRSCRVPARGASLGELALARRFGRLVLSRADWWTRNTREATPARVRYA
ncbi:hypothetical protein N5079_24690 [Planotetraspora sp. A-T 1434]|uniref:hypothetical protein n=1 Tax=Planotetraspora sp. A-T 1434 TaxID=2979219 RepID=UPI0021BFF055|nr:hypothetical protein [Planotetraspora sp. A-T 1434]MCT9933416.1 hypothetical protein [Planotetraspora sp. A-T 1434]